MVDAADSKSVVERRGGSSPPWGTINRLQTNTIDAIVVAV